MGVYFVADRLREHLWFSLSMDNQKGGQALVEVQSTTEDVLDVETDIELYMLPKEVDLKKLYIFSSDYFT